MMILGQWWAEELTSMNLMSEVWLCQQGDKRAWVVPRLVRGGTRRLCGRVAVLALVKCGWCAGLSGLAVMSLRFRYPEGNTSVFLTLSTSTRLTRTSYTPIC